MNIYIALLRGINVGGKNIIKMADLKKAFEDLGLNEVKTYIQSGNVLFKSDEEEETLRKKIEHKIETTFEMCIHVVLRTAEEFESIIKSCPFTEEEIQLAQSTSVGESLYVALLTQEPLQERVEKLLTYKNLKEQCEIKGREVFLLFHESILKSKLANNLQKLEIPSTVRNWKTINKLSSLAKAMKGINI